MFAVLVERTAAELNPLKVITNNVPRPILSWYELTEKEQKEYLEEQYSMHFFVRYKGRLEPLCSFMKPGPNSPFPPEWQGYSPDSFYSGLLIRFTEDQEQAIIGTYIG